MGIGRYAAGQKRNRRTVEHLAVFEEAFVDDFGRHGDVLFLTLGIGEAQVNELGFLLFNEAECVSGCHYIPSGVLCVIWLLNAGYERPAPAVTGVPLVGRA